VPDRPASPGSSAPAITHGTRLPRRSKYDLIMFSPIDWDFRYQRPQQLASQFAEDGHRVFYVSITFVDPSSPGGGASAYLTEVRPHVYEVRLTAPHGLTVYRSRLGGEALEWFAEAVARLCDEQGVVDAVSIVQLPFWRPLAIRLRERFGWAIVYDCLDRHSGFSTNDPAMLHEEEGLVRASDLVVATAARLFEDHRATNPRCVLVQNAADFSHFSAFVGEPAAWLQQLRRPVIGYHGAIAEWFDTALVGALARLRPQWTFVLVGSTFTADLGPLLGLANVHLPGEQPYARLPAFLHSFDVCLIPFKRNPLTEATNPVKFYEYMSAGKPVVSVTLPELDQYAREGLVAFADTAAEFAAQIERAIETDSPAEAGRRRSFAEQNTWHDRYVQFSDAIRDAHPLASIIIPTHNNLHLTRLCLEGIFRNTSWPHVEIVVVDNASSDGTPAYLGDLAARHESVRCIFNERNEGFARANNQGIAASRGDYVVLLNNDTIVTRGWLSTMIRFAQAHPDVGMIGPATNLAGNEAKINVEYTNLAEMEAFAEAYTRAHAGEILEPAMLGFFCVLIPRRVLDEVGLLDERFGIGMFEDDDLSLRVRRAGYRLVCTDGAFVHHFHSATMRRLSEEEYLTLFEANREKYEQKWNIRWAPHRYRWQR
jgi:GT2 family glycosyltransferase/glycosyltransferase involved in cell wall biosynthesis